MVIHGREDGIPLEVAGAWAAGYADARLLVVSPSGHFPFIEQKEPALEAIETQIPDLLILDQMLPGRSGFLVLEKIRSIRAESGKPPVIMITANPGTRHKVYAETLGVDFYLNKPFRMDKLTNAAKDLLSK